MKNVEGEPIPILDDDLKIIGTVPFRDNLTLSHVPDYVNFNGLMGISRLTEGHFKDELGLMFYDVNYPGNSYAELVSEKEAYKTCLNRGKLDVAKELELQFAYEVEVL